MLSIVLNVCNLALNTYNTQENLSKEDESYSPIPLIRIGIIAIAAMALVWLHFPFNPRKNKQKKLISECERVYATYIKADDSIETNHNLSLHTVLQSHYELLNPSILPSQGMIKAARCLVLDNEKQEANNPSYKPKISFTCYTILLISSLNQDNKEELTFIRKRITELSQVNKVIFYSGIKLNHFMGAELSKKIQTFMTEDLYSSSSEKKNDTKESANSTITRHIQPATPPISKKNSVKNTKKNRKKTKNKPAMTTEEHKVKMAADSGAQRLRAEELAKIKIAVTQKKEKEKTELAVAKVKETERKKTIAAVAAVKKLERARKKTVIADTQKLEREKTEAAIVNAQRIEREKAAEAVAETQRLEREKADKAVAKAQRLEREKAQRDGALRLEKEKVKKAEALRLEKEKAESAEALRLEKEKAERAEAQKLEIEKAEAEAQRLEIEKNEKVIAEAKRVEREIAAEAIKEEINDPDINNVSAPFFTGSEQFPYHPSAQTMPYFSGAPMPYHLGYYYPPAPYDPNIPVPTYFSGYPSSFPLYPLTPSELSAAMAYYPHPSFFSYQPTSSNGINYPQPEETTTHASAPSSHTAAEPAAPLTTHSNNRHRLFASGINNQLSVIPDIALAKRSENPKVP